MMMMMGNGGTLPTGDLDDDEGGGLSLNSQSRALLMQKLQRGQSSSSSVPPPPPDSVGPSSIASPCVWLKHMFDPESETEPNWENDIRDDVNAECSKFGSLIHIYVDKHSQGFVYLKFGSIPAAQNAINALNGRWFAGRQIVADFVAESVYHHRFPESK